MVVEPVLVIGGPLARVQALPDLAVEQFGAAGISLANWRQPASVVSALSWVFAGFRDGGHHGFFASSKGSKIPSGITLASGLRLGLLRDCARRHGIAGFCLVLLPSFLRGGRPGAGGDPPVPLAHAGLRLSVRPRGGAAQQFFDGVGDLLLGGLAAEAVAGVVPGELAERMGTVSRYFQCGDPAVRAADEDPGHVIGVVADLPEALALLDAGRLLPQRAELLAS